MVFAPNINIPGSMPFASTSNPNAGASTTTGPTVPRLSHLPVSHLESLRHKADQIMESIRSLQYTIDAGGHAFYMPAWPDILSKYNVLLTRAHTFSNSLVNPINVRLLGEGQGNGNVYERIALHPTEPMSDLQLDSEFVQLVRNQQTIDVLKVENDTVGKLAEKMTTKGSLGVLGTASTDDKPTLALNGFPNYKKKKPEYSDVLQECAEIAEAHDKRVERAVRAVLMLRDRFDWKQRVEVEVEEPEELEWDPRFGRPVEPNDQEMKDDADEVEGNGNDNDNEMNSPTKQDSSSDEEDANGIQGQLMDSQAMEGQSPMPAMQQQDSPSDPLFSPSGSGGLFGSDVMSPTSNGVLSPAGGMVGDGGGPMSPAGEGGTPMEIL